MVFFTKFMEINFSEYKGNYWDFSETVWKFLILALMWRFYAINMRHIMNPKKTEEALPERWGVAITL
jgi:hypothetical protein